MDDGLVRGTQTAVDSFYMYTDLAVRFQFKPPRFLSPTTSLEFCGFVIRMKVGNYM